MKNKCAVIKAIIGSAVGVAGVSSAGFLGAVIKDSKKDYDGELHYLFVLGGLIIGEETPSEHLLKRIKKAAEYLDSHPSTFAVTCGGCFRDGQKKSEALIIKEHLIALGIDENRIILEDKSTTTNENFKFGKKIVEEHSGKEFYELKTGFLSSDYHLFRAGVIAKINGLPGLHKIGAKSTLKDFTRGAVRELIVAPDLINNYMSNK
ncbi:MAG: YdcF family protein [Ruminococcaceae bacterium]|nr:YdcF family protein [Oscillospiraceae bacterium]